MTFILIVLFVLVPVNVLHAANKTAYREEKGAHNAEKNAAEIADAIKQLQKNIAEISAQLQSAQADIFQEKADQQKTIQGLSALEERMNGVVSDNQLQKNIADIHAEISSTKADVFQEKTNLQKIKQELSVLEEKMNRVVADLKHLSAEEKVSQKNIEKSQILLQNIKQEYENQVQQFHQRRKDLEIIGQNTTEEMMHYVDAIEKRHRILLQGAADAWDKKCSDFERMIQEHKIDADMTMAQYKKDLARSAEEKIRGIKELQGDSAHIKHLEEIVNYLMMTQSLLLSIPATYLFCGLISKVWNLMLKKKPVSADRMTTMQSLKQMAKKMLAGVGVATTYSIISFLLYRSGRFAFFRESLLPYDDLGTVLPLL